VLLDAARLQLGPFQRSKRRDSRSSTFIRREANLPAFQIGLAQNWPETGTLDIENTNKSSYNHRAFASGAKGRWFESTRAYHFDLFSITYIAVLWCIDILASTQTLEI
jgi:hypothetical protein